MSGKIPFTTHVILLQMKGKNATIILWDSYGKQNPKTKGEK